MNLPPSPSPDSEQSIDVSPLLQMLRRKEQTWLDWGKACQQLQKAGYSPQQIFEETGFEAIQQNQIIVAEQVYQSIQASNAESSVLDYFRERRSDILYEFRILNQMERSQAAQLAASKQLDADEAREITKALKSFYAIQPTPPDFTDHPGDAVAYQSWWHARQKSDLQERSRLIGQGLKFVHSNTAREKLQQLLTDFSVVKTQTAPRLPWFRLDSDQGLPRIMPLVGRWPLTLADLKAAPLVEADRCFGMVQTTSPCAWVALPSWQIILRAEDPVALITPAQTLGPDLPQPTEEVLVIVDRDQRQWQDDSHFLVDLDGQLQVAWFAQAPTQKLWGQVILVMRPQRVLDVDYSKDLWSLEE